ncbi:MAG TPA: hypothetical protein VN813_12200 [Luteibacter sp.]|nr:hypothetical protein [Luteibacter sp.]
MKRLTRLQVPPQWESSLLETLGDVPRAPSARRGIAVVGVLVAVVLAAVAAVLFFHP